MGCIGIEFSGPKHCEIKHIAVSPSCRGEGIGSEMIDFIKDKYTLLVIAAETDKML
ncbi:GNAT family N-acetyltransferase [Lysinibacillus sp. FSL H8-0500]|uniref:GNAT family N-acetyltransferase n=1 Tax=Lysinibacillus sp. FSL H8-0500 TaxID=2921393 RepID=UPI0031012A6A